jgi:hypothetical protein
MFFRQIKIQDQIGYSYSEYMLMRPKATYESNLLMQIICYDMDENKLFLAFQVQREISDLRNYTWLL